MTESYTNRPKITQINFLKIKQSYLFMFLYYVILTVTIYFIVFK